MHGSFILATIHTATASTASIAHPLAMAIAAKKLAKSGRIRFEREFGDRSSAVRAFPISLEHLALKTALITFHFIFVSFSYLYANRR